MSHFCSIIATDMRTGCARRKDGITSRAGTDAKAGRGGRAPLRDSIAAARGLTPEHRKSGPGIENARAG